MFSAQGLAAADAAVQAAGAFALRDKPLVQYLARYWWLSVPAAIAIGTQLHRRHKKGDLNLYEGLKDSATILGFVAAAISIAEAARKSSPGPLPQGATIKDASFTVTPPAAASQG